MSKHANQKQGALREIAPVYAAGKADIDVSLLEDSLRLTPWQRLVENDRALGLVRMLEQAKIREDGTAHSNS